MTRTCRAVREDVASIRTRIEQLVFTVATASLAKQNQLLWLHGNALEVSVVVWCEVVGQPITFSLMTQVEVELGCDNIFHNINTKHIVSWLRDSNCIQCQQIIRKYNNA